MDRFAEDRASSKKCSLSIIALTLFLMALVLILWGRSWYYDLDRLPRGTVLEQQQSPNNKYTLIAYLSDAGATTSLSLLCELRFNDGNAEHKTIYFQKDTDAVSIDWIDEDHVTINGHQLRVPDEIYDDRKE